MKTTMSMLCGALAMLGVIFASTYVMYLGIGIGGKGESHGPGPTSDLIPHRIGDKYGYIDRSGNVRISPRFGWAGGFTEGLASVKVDGRWGFVNEAGEVVIEARYDSVGSFRDGVAEATLRGHSRMIDKNGRRVTLTALQKERRDLKARGLWGCVCVLCVTGVLGSLDLLAIGVLGVLLIVRRGRASGSRGQIPTRSRDGGEQ
jgi:hypothetical protein